jgi:hypothetical protein
MSSKQIADLSHQESKHIGTEFYQSPHLMVSALQVGSPKGKHEKGLTFTTKKGEYEMPERMHDSKRVMSIMRNLHRTKGPTLVGLEVNRLEL